MYCNPDVHQMFCGSYKQGLSSTFPNIIFLLPYISYTQRENISVSVKPFLFKQYAHPHHLHGNPHSHLQRNCWYSVRRLWLDCTSKPTNKDNATGIKLHVAGCSRVKVDVSTFSFPFFATRSSAYKSLWQQKQNENL